MKILYLMDQMHTHGGGEKILSLKMNSLVANFGCEVYLLTTEQENKPFVYNISTAINWLDLGINYRRTKSYFHPVNLIKTVRHFFKLKKKINKIIPDVIISVSQSPEQYFLPFINKNIPKVKEFHSSGVIYKNPKNSIQKIKQQLFLMYKKYHAVVVLNKDERHYYPFKNVVVIPNFITRKDNILLKDVPRENVIIAAGRIAPVKQFDHLIKAWNGIAHKFPDWEVHIYGDGDEHLMKNLNQLIDDLGTPNIQLKGATSNLTAKMQTAALYALTSSTECFPMVLLESLACGLPILSYNCPHGPKNILVDGEDGVLVPLNAIDTFAMELEKLLIHKAIREQMGVKAFKNSCKFGEDRIMQQWLKLFKEM